MNKKITRLQRLKSANNLSDLAKILNIKPAHLSYVLYILEDKEKISKYNTFQFPKRKGGVRTIQAPTERLKSIQSRLSELLYVCLREINLTKNISHPISFAYQPNVSIFENAKIHKKKKYVFNIDLKDFFNSINFGRVRGYFINNKFFELNPNVATVIAQIACYENSLPQGSPCSPIISHLIATILDQRLLSLAKKAGCSYSRYCDDITFSTNKTDFPKLIAELDSDNTWNPSNELTKIISHSGFTINLEKVRMSYYSNQQSVTGLVVNKRVNTLRKYRDTVRALVHSYYTNGDFDFKGEFKRDKIKDKNKARCLEGMLNYIKQIDSKDTQTKNSSKIISSKNSQVFKNFILYHYFIFSVVKVLISLAKERLIKIT